MADYGRAAALMDQGQVDKGIEAARSIIAQHSNTVEAAWAQVHLGEGLIKIGKDNPAAFREMLKAEIMLPDRRDLTPLNDLRDTIGYYCEVWLRNHNDALDAADFLGLDKTDPRVKAKVLAIVAAFRARRGRAENSIDLLKRMEDECRDETEEITWARCRVAIGYLGHNEPNGSFAPTAVKWLCDMQSRAGDDLAAESCLALARYYSLNGRLSDAVAVLESGREKYLDTARGVQILYALGCVLDRQGKRAEAIAAMKDLMGRKPLAPFYSSLAEFFIEQQSKLGGASSVVSAIEQAEASYSPAWRSIAYCATDPMLDPTWMTAAQAIALVKEEFAGEALRLISNVTISRRLTPEELLRARGEVLLFSLRSAPSLDRLMRRDHRMILPFLMETSDDDEIAQIHMVLLDAATSIILLPRAQPDDASCQQKAAALEMIANAYFAAEKFSNAIPIYDQLSDCDGLSDESRARHMYTLGFCYREVGNDSAAESTMRSVIGRYPATYDRAGFGIPPVRECRDLKSEGFRSERDSKSRPIKECAHSI